MSKKPYIVQEGSPNLVIVPTDAVYEPKKVEESEALVKPTPSSSYSSVFTRKTSAKLNYSVNNDVLIDVRKVQRSPKSWATNFLQSIGGPSTKFDRIYALAPKPTSLLKNSTIQPVNDREDTVTNIINQQHKSNIKSTPQIMEKNTSQPKININLTKPKPPPQPTLAKEASKPNCNTKNNTTSKPTDVRKEPSLPKNYKIPMQSKCNKPPISLTDKETCKSNSSNSITSKNHRSNEDMVRPNYNEIAIPNITTNKDMAGLNKNKKPNQLKHDLNNSQHIKHPDKTQVKVNKNTEHTKHSNETKQIKTNKVTDRHISPKHEETAQPVNNKENNQPKHYKESIQRKAVKDTDLQKNHKDHCLQRSTSLKTNEDMIAHIKTIKEMYRLKHKQELSYSTKIKTKKEHISIASRNVSKLAKGKIAKHIKSKDNQSKDTRSKKHTNKSVTNNETHLTPTLLTKKDLIAKLKKKRALENKSSQGECSSNKTKKIRLSSPDTNVVKNKIPKTVNKERLSKSNSPIKSVVSRIQTDQPFHNSETIYHKKSDCYHSHYNKTSTYRCQNSDKHFKISSNVDLRTKLKRKNSKSDYRKDVHKLSYAKKDKLAIVPNGDRFVPEENLIISFNAEKDSEETLTMKKSPVKKLARKQPSPKDKKCKKIKLEINIVFGQGDTTDEESTKSETETNAETVEHMDLSFLDDFNVDEIAESLNECKDCKRKPNETEVTEVDINVQDSISGDNKKKEMIVNEHSMCQDIRSAENNLENYLKTSVHPTVTKHRPCREETQNINSIIGKGVDDKGENQGISKEITSELSQENSPIVNTSSNHSSTNITFDKAQECATTDNKNCITQFKSNCEEKERTHDMRENKTKLERTEIIIDTANEKQHLTSKPPMAMSRSESNIYSDRNDIIDALQDNSNLEINAIKSYIASLNNYTNNQTRFDQKDATNTNNESTILTYIKEDPDVILIDDSDTETEIKNNQLVKDNNATDIKPGNESLPDKSGEVPIVEPTVENSETILILDANETSQAAKKSRLNTSDEVTIIDLAGENSEPILILDTNAETSQPAKKSRLDKLDEVIIIEPAGDNSEPILILDNAETSQPVKNSPLDRSDDVTIIESASEKSDSTLILDISAEDLQYVKNSQLDNVMDFEPTGVNSETVLEAENNVEENNSTLQLNDGEQNDADSKNITLSEQRKTEKTILEDALIEIITNKSADIDSENQSTKEIGPEIEKTELHQNKDNLPNKAKVASEIDEKTSGESPSKATTVKESITAKCTPKTVTANTKTQNVNTKRNTKTHSKVNSETHNEDKEKVNENSDVKEAERSFSLANSKFVQMMESKLAPFMGQKCTVTGVIRYDGRYSKIYRCKDADNQDYAIKSLKKQYDGYNVGLLKQNMMLELQNGVPEDNLNCVRYINGFLVSGLWCFLMEYFPMNLQQALMENKRCFHIDDVQVLSRQLVSAVTILRNNNIIHSDIKPSHILINASQTRIKLCGFDKAAYFEDINLLPNTGTVNYRAPELILGYPAGYGIDVWSTALVMYEMATTRKLFPGFFNNNILHQQLSTLGAIPMEMLMESKFRNAHFRGMAFIKFCGKNERCIVDEIEFDGRLNRDLFQAYTTDWGQIRKANKRIDNAKIRAFSDLLHQMLAMHPRYRIAIEFVFANPFIYESFDNC